jgi:diacylglycerol kinase (ATP)
MGAFLSGFGGNRVKLIFNPKAGAARKPRVTLDDVLRELRDMGLRPDYCAVEPGRSIPSDVREALEQGFRLFAVCGGDGTVSATAGVLAGTRATLAIIPTGSQNNMALSLGIPTAIREAAALLRKGRRVRVDVGEASCGGRTSCFLETCSVGLVSALSPSGEAIQHGDLSGVGEFLGTLISSEPADMELLIDGGERICGRGHIALAANMPYIGFHYRSGPALCCADGKFELLFFEGLSKLDLLAFVTRGVHIDKPDDPRIRRISARSIEIRTKPVMPVMADGRALGECPVKISVMKRALTVLAPRSWPN